MTASARDIWLVEVVLRGIAKRERKVKMHYLKVAELPLDGTRPEMTAELQESASRIVKARMRQWENSALRFTPEKLITCDETGIVMREQLLYDGRTVNMPLVV